MEPEQLVISSVSAQNFKSITGAASIQFRRSQGRLIALVGVNGAASHLRVQQFRDLGGGSQLPNVTVLWKSCAGKELKLQTTLNKDRDRVFRLNGTIVTKAAVTRRLLKERLYGDFTFIRQAQVGKIVQTSGSSKALAAIISEVSGGASQRQAAQQASSSLSAFRTQLTHVRQSIASLQILVDDSSTFQKLLGDRMGVLGADIATQDRLLADMRSSKAEHVSQDESRALKVAKFELQSAQQQLEEAQGAAMLAAEEALQAESVRKRLHAARAASTTHAQDLETARAALATQESLLKGVKEALQSGEKQSAMKRFREELAATELEAQRLRGARQESLHALDREVQAQSALKLQLENQLLESSNERLCMQRARTAKHAADSTVALAATSHRTAERHSASEKEKLLARCPQVKSNTAQPFLMAFMFKPTHLDTVRRCQLALSLLMAPAQDVLLVPCMADVSRVLKANNGRANLRVWPLDSITYADRSTSLTRICKEWPEGALVNPVDLCHFDSNVDPAIHRVFGTVLVAANDQVAAQVLAKHGVSCITQAGTRHSRGSLEGGWRNPGSTPSTCSHKLAAQQAAAAADEAAQHLEQSRAHQTAARERLEACEETEQAQAELHRRIETSEACERAHKQKIKQHDSAFEVVKTKCRDLRELVSGTLGQEAAEGDTHGDRTKTGLDTVQLKHAAAVAEKRVKELHAEVLEAETSAEVLKDQQVELEQRLEGIDVDLLHCTKDEASKRVDDCESALADSRAHVAAAERACDLATAEQKLLDEKIQEAKKAVGDLQQDYDHTCREQQSVQESHDLAQLHLDKHGQRFMHDSNRQRAQMQSKGDASIASTDSATAAVAQDYTENTIQNLGKARTEHHATVDSFRRAEKRWRACSKKLEAAVGDKGKGGMGDPAERHTAATRRETLQRTQQHMQMLEEASQVLKDDVESSGAYSMALSRAVFDRAARMFKHSMASAIPQLQFDARMCGATLDDGVEILFREASDRNLPERSTGTDQATGHCNDDSDSDSQSRGQGEQQKVHVKADESGGFIRTPGEGSQAQARRSTSDWSSNLGELSEGQGSICALVFVMSAASSGVKPAVLLVDEVDAALDGVNQSLAGQLLAQAASALHCQVWAVSHSDAFHACCDTFVKVSKGSEGTSVDVLEASSYRGVTGAQRASAGGQRVTTGQLRASAGLGKPPQGVKRVGSWMNADERGDSAPKRKVARRR